MKKRRSISASVAVGVSTARASMAVTSLCSGVDALAGCSVGSTIFRLGRTEGERSEDRYFTARRCSAGRSQAAAAVGAPPNLTRSAPEPQPVAELGEDAAGAVARLRERVAGLREPGRLEGEHVQHQQPGGEREQGEQSGQRDPRAAGRRAALQQVRERRQRGLQQPARRRVASIVAIRCGPPAASCA